jgi:hypothetical protein
MIYQNELTKKIEQKKLIKKEIKLLKKLVKLNQLQTSILKTPKPNNTYTHNDLSNISVKDIKKILQDNICSISYINTNASKTIFHECSMCPEYISNINHPSLYTEQHLIIGTDYVEFVFIVEKKNNKFKIKKIYIDKIQFLTIIA